MGEHLFYGKIVPVFANPKSRSGGTGHRVANHGRVTCSCGYDSGEQVSLPEAQRIADQDHPQGIKRHPGY